MKCELLRECKADLIPSIRLCKYARRCRVWHHWCNPQETAEQLRRHLEEARNLRMAASSPLHPISSTDLPVPNHDPATTRTDAPSYLPDAKCLTSQSDVLARLHSCITKLTPMGNRWQGVMIYRGVMYDETRGNGRHSQQVICGQGGGLTVTRPWDTRTGRDVLSRRSTACHCLRLHASLRAFLPEKRESRCYASA